ncbi:response regulator [Hydrogenoanaerobacterium sp.]|uniref:response regulator transcription factor n=1 Tax=Hydrogenoanaerobacterium sp. TaxID=2953763 RepID=UPI0028964C77|nr:response regulator [Hydrogenoanaerobacterium sp.]
MAVKLLIADDEDAIRNGMANYIRLYSNHIDKVYTAANGQEALDLIIRHEPDLMLLDIQMPILNGIEVMKEADKAGILPRTIILSGYDEFKYAQQALRHGADDYLLKPCRSTEILARLDTILEKMQGSLKETQQAHQTNYLVDSAVEYMKEHYNENLTLADVSKKVGITSGYLSTLFSQNRSIGFVDFLNEIRIEHACIYLQQYQMKTYEVAFKVGFKDEKYFSKVFKKVMDMSPLEFRKTQKEAQQIKRIGESV